MEELYRRINEIEDKYHDLDKNVYGAAGNPKELPVRTLATFIENFESIVAEAEQVAKDARKANIEEVSLDDYDVIRHMGLSISACRKAQHTRIHFIDLAFNEKKEVLRDKYDDYEILLAEIKGLEASKKGLLESLEDYNDSEQSKSIVSKKIASIDKKLEKLNGQISPIVAEIMGIYLGADTTEKFEDHEEDIRRIIGKKSKSRHLVDELEDEEDVEQVVDVERNDAPEEFVPAPVPVRAVPEETPVEERTLPDPVPGVAEEGPVEETPLPDPVSGVAEEGPVEETSLPDPVPPVVEEESKPKDETSKAEVVAAPATLLQKFTAICAAAAAFLSGGHLLLHFIDHMPAGVTKEAEKDVTPTPTPEPTPSPSPSPEPAPSPSPAPNPTPSPTPTPEPGKEPDPILINHGDSAYNTETGVEVTYDGTTYEKGNQTGQQTLIQNDDGYAEVKKSNLEPKKEETVLPPTGNETPYEEAIKTMDEGDKEVLDDAVEDFDWAQFFEDTYGSSLK